jgi:hypothetical protein
MAHLQRTIDTLLELEDGAAALTDASLSSDIVDLGGDTIKGTATTARMACAVEMLVSAIDFTTADEVYDIFVVGSNTATVDSGVAILGHINFGDAGTHVSAITGLTDQLSTGRYVIPFINEKAGTVYRYISLWLQQSGTTPSITCKAWLSKVSEFPI